MRNLFHKCASFALAFLVLFSTISFTVEKHFCGEILIDQAIFSEAQTCGMENIPGMEDHCNHQQVQVEGQDDLKHSFEDLDLNQKIFLVTFSLSYAELFAIEEQQEVAFRNYIPPRLIYDIQVRDQVFLI